MSRPLPAFNPPSRFEGQISKNLHDRLILLQRHTEQYEQYVRDFVTVLTERFNDSTQGFAQTDIPATATVEISSYLTRITGTGVISTIQTAPETSGQLVFEALNGFSTTTTGNIANAITVAANTIVLLNYSPVTGKWFVVAAPTVTPPGPGPGPDPTPPTDLTSLIQAVAALQLRVKDVYTWWQPGETSTTLFIPPKLRAAANGTLVELVASVRIAPQGGNIETIFFQNDIGMQGARITSGNIFGTTFVSAGAQTILENSLVHVDVEQVGAVFPGSDLVVQARVR